LLAAAFAGLSLAYAQPMSEANFPCEDPVNNPSSLRLGADIPMVPNGATPSPGWALARLNDGDNPPATYLYPETSNPVRLYLIDTAVANPDQYFSEGNENLTIASVIPIRAAGEPMGSSAFIHGTKMLSIIAGSGTGAALGTPIEVINYDIYPGGEGSETTSGALADAIFAAVLENGLSTKPAVICIAAGSPATEGSPLLEFAIDQAVEAGITVVVSAGNSNQDASNFLPSAYGTKDGVICVGASNAANEKWEQSSQVGTNDGLAVDIYAPGDAVAATKFGNPNAASSAIADTMDGTSPAAALVTAAALATLSMDPELTPADLEARLKESAFTDTVDLVQLPPTDSDGDGAHDLLERFAGSDHLDPANVPARPALKGSAVAGGKTSIKLSFVIDSDLFNPGNVQTLTDGSSWKIKESSNVSDWSDSTGGSLSFGVETDGKIPVTYTRTGSEACCFLKLEITPAP
jgi:hypothetical protein